jgi:hypothetical protein
VVLLTAEPYAFGPADAADLVGHRVRQVDGTGLFWWGPRTAATVADLRRLARHLRLRARLRTPLAGPPGGYPTSSR